MNLGMDFNINYPNFNISISQSIKVPVTGIFGPSGSGKTSILNSLAGLLKPGTGQIFMDGCPYFDSSKGINLPPEKRNIGYVFQEDRLFPHMDVEGNLQFAYRRAKNNGRKRHSPHELAEKLGIFPLLKRSFQDLSGGEKRRVAIVRSILSGAKLLLLDEPTNGLDRDRIGDMVELLKKLRDNGIEMLMVTHDLETLLALTDQVILMENGSCVANGNFWEVLDNPAARRILRGAGMVNVFSVRLEGNCPNSGLYLWKPQDREKTSLTNLSPLLRTAHSNGGGKSLATLVIRPEDIALSLESIRCTSIQNQLCGKIVKRYVNGERVHIVVDVGIPLLVSIVPHADRSMQLEEGMPIWCLIKSGAIRFIPNPGTEQ